ncbi:hypothetical protein Ddye_022486 [Dipteronia dyeriana]|uniref:RRM domain-containing protein n=1 Tax=Dipteronia dyeriana TaxID=168575 RepID=A0AAD9TRN6_9ROSI|nr:hypothetical protein Ddye_022486 [Dipteronia dyeriana]
MSRERGRVGGGKESFRGGKVFMVGLISVFIDNLIHEVDIAGLWGIFKSFRKVRDIFLSAKSRNRSCLFAFIRFSSRMEANKVTKMVDGWIRTTTEQKDVKDKAIQWMGQNGDGDWLLKCVVGVFKQFGSIRNCWGVPLSCWNPSFFSSLGRKFGDLVHLKEDTISIRRLDMGCMLMAIPVGSLGPSYCNMEINGKSLWKAKVKAMAIYDKTTKLDLQKKEEQVDGKETGKSGFSTSCEDSTDSFTKEGLMWRGECSRLRVVGPQSPSSDQTYLAHQRQPYGSPSSKSNDEDSDSFMDDTFIKAHDPYKDTRPQKEDFDFGFKRQVPDEERKIVAVENNKAVISEDSERNGANEGMILDLEGNETADTREISLSVMLVTLSLKKKETKSKGISSKKHEMITIRDKNMDVQWKLDVKITKVVEKGRGEKRRTVRDLVSFHKPMVFFIQESKLNSFDNITIVSLSGSLLTKGVGVEAEGLISIWDENLFKCRGVLVGLLIRFWIRLKEKGSNMGSIKSFNDFVLKAQINSRRDSICFKDLEKKLLGVEVKAVLEGWMSALREDRLSIIADMWNWLRKEETLWKQKSRVKWLMEGDKNSKKFHCVANSRRKANFIGDIVVEVECLSGPADVRREVLNHLKLHYKRTMECRPKIWDLVCRKFLVLKLLSLRKIFHMRKCGKRILVVMATRLRVRMTLILIS